MYIRKISFNGIRGINKKIELDFSPSKDKMFMENVETFGLERDIAEFSVLKQIAFTGLNGSGKTSILVGVSLLSIILLNPNLNSILNFHRNIFSDENIKYDAEIVLSYDEENKLARKYSIDFEIENGVFKRECVKFTEATKTSSKPWKEIYCFENNVLTIGEKQSNVSHNNLYSIFGLISSGQINREIFGDIEKQHPFFRQFNIHFDALNNSIGSPTYLPRIPKFKKHQEILVSLLKTFDAKIENVVVDQAGSCWITFRGGNKTEKIRLENAITLLSSGTKIALDNFITLLHSLTSDSIVVYDELGANIHTGLFRFYFEIFKKSKGQFIFTTHNQSIFIQKIRRDQIFNVKNIGSEIEMQRLSEFDIDKRYISSKAVYQELDAFPDENSIFDFFNVLEKSLND